MYLYEYIFLWKPLGATEEVRATSELQVSGSEVNDKYDLGNDQYEKRWIIY